MRPEPALRLPSPPPGVGAAFVRKGALVLGKITSVFEGEHVVDRPVVVLPAPGVLTKLRFDGRQLEDLPGQKDCFVALAAGTRSWSPSSEGTSPFSFVMFDPDWLAALNLSVSGGWAPQPARPKPLPVEIPLYLARLSEEDSGTLLADSLATVITLELARALHPGHEPTTPWVGNHPGVRRAVERIRAEFDQPLTLGLLAAEAHLSPSHFLAQFRRAMGVTPHAYLRNLRIAAACRYLEKGADVAPTAYAVGYTSLSGFEQAFRLLRKMAPADYREQANAQRVFRR